MYTAAGFGAVGCQRHRRYGVHASSLQLLAQDFNLGCYSQEVLLSCVGRLHILYFPKMFRQVQSWQPCGSPEIVICFQDMLEFDGNMDVLVFLHSLYFFIIQCIVGFLLIQSFKSSYLVKNSIRSHYVILQHLVSFISHEHPGWRFKAECWRLLLDDGGSAWRGW